MVQMIRFQRGAESQEKVHVATLNGSLDSFPSHRINKDILGESRFGYLHMHLYFLQRCLLNLKVCLGELKIYI